MGVFGLFSYRYFESSRYARDQFNYGLLVVVNKERWWLGGQLGWLVPIVGRRCLVHCVHLLVKRIKI